jgi:hypothetical protein
MKLRRPRICAQQTKKITAAEQVESRTPPGANTLKDVPTEKSKMTTLVPAESRTISLTQGGKAQRPAALRLSARQCVLHICA